MKNRAALNRCVCVGAFCVWTASNTIKTRTSHDVDGGHLHENKIWNSKHWFYGVAKQSTYALNHHTFLLLADLPLVPTTLVISWTNKYSVIRYTPGCVLFTNRIQRTPAFLHVCELCALYHVSSPSTRLWWIATPIQFSTKICANALALRHSRSYEKRIRRKKSSKVMRRNENEEKKKRQKKQQRYSYHSLWRVCSAFDSNALPLTAQHSTHTRNGEEQNENKNVKRLSFHSILVILSYFSLFFRFFRSLCYSANKCIFL